LDAVVAHDAVGHRDAEQDVGDAEGEGVAAAGEGDVLADVDGEVVVLAVVDRGSVRAQDAFDGLGDAATRAVSAAKLLSGSGLLLGSRFARRSVTRRAVSRSRF
jgi:hypothetical protein